MTTIRDHLAEQSKRPRNSKLDDDDARTIKQRLDAGERVCDVHQDYRERVSVRVIGRIKTGERMVR